MHIRQSGLDIGKVGSWVFNQVGAINDASPQPQLDPSRLELCKDGMLGWVSWHLDATSTGPVPVATMLNEHLLGFADWAFGAEGITSLRLLVYGDFSSRGRFADSCFMLRRGSLGGSDGGLYRFFFPESEREPELEELLDRHARCLEACPVS